MARECKQKRDEKRFGGSRARLIDLAVDPSKWVYPKLFEIFTNTPRGQENFAGARAEMLASLSVCVPVSADNVCEFLYAQSHQENWVVTRDFPNCSPPFENLFIEFVRPSRILSEGRISSSSPLPSRWGWHLKSQEVRDQGILLGWHIGATLFMEHPNGGRVLPFCAMFVLEVDGNGTPKQKPRVLIPGGTSIPEAERQAWIDTLYAYSFPAFLALSFMNCKNVTTNGVEPDPKLNRERRKAGLNPFLRYHTINIEPMKKVLKTEGNIETNGLQKALHICRGHFATYTEDKPLFGHTVGTVWRPSHIRGSAKNGVVVSGYNINTPTA